MCSAARALALFVLTSASLVAAKACSPDTCGLVVQAKNGVSFKEIAQHRNDCSSFLSVTVVPPTSTIYVTDVRTFATVRDTVGTLSSTETDTLTSSATVTDVVTISGETTLQSTDTTTTTTTSTFTSTSTTVVTSTYTSATTTTTSEISSTTASTLTVVTTSTTTRTSTTTATETDISRLPYPYAAVKRRATGLAHDAVTISPSKIPDYASRACGRGTSSYSSACAVWGIKPRTTTKPTPRTTVYSKTLATATVYTTAHTTVTLTVEVTNTATAESTFVTSSTALQVSSTTETDTLTSSATVTTTSTVPTTVTSTETDTSSITVATIVVTTTATTDVVSATETVSTTTTTVAPWCSNNAVVRANGCHQSQFTTYCNMAIFPIYVNRAVFQAHELSLEDCMGICDSNGFSTSGTYDGTTGTCTLYAYAGSTFNQFAAAEGDVQSFEFIFGSYINAFCPAYECPDSAVAQCCGGAGCADFTWPYGA